MIEVNRAIADLAEVRDRLASLQRFRGISGWAAVASGVTALAAGVVQAATVPHPVSAADRHVYILIWLTCLASALALNYGAIVAWTIRHWTARARTEMRSVGMSIVPAIAAGGVLSIALVDRGLFSLLPGMWCATYALGLFAARAMVPAAVTVVAIAFGAAATVLLLAPRIDPLAWWVMPLVFGAGQVAIGVLVLAERVDAS